MDHFLLKRSPHMKPRLLGPLQEGPGPRRAWSVGCEAAAGEVCQGAGQEQEGSLFNQFWRCVGKFPMSGCVLQLLTSRQQRLRKLQQTIPPGLTPDHFLYFSRLEGLEIRGFGGQENTAPDTSRDTQVGSCIYIWFVSHRAYI